MYIIFRQKNPARICWIFHESQGVFYRCRHKLYIVLLKKASKVLYNSDMVLNAVFKYSSKRLYKDIAKQLSLQKSLTKLESNKGK